METQSIIWRKIFPTLKIEITTIPKTTTRDEGRGEGIIILIMIIQLRVKMEIVAAAVIDREDREREKITKAPKLSAAPHYYQVKLHIQQLLQQPKLLFSHLETMMRTIMMRGIINL
jgi:hypothetical protein